MPEQGSVKLFCPRCVDLYIPPSTSVHSLDGCAFGTSSSHLMIMNNKDLFDPIRQIWASKAFNLSVSTEPNDHGAGNQSYVDPSGIYVPRLFGFKLHALSKNGPRMSWLRRTNVASVVGSSPAVTAESSRRASLQPSSSVNSSNPNLTQRTDSRRS
jgi:casein kinase II subunit beta